MATNDPTRADGTHVTEQNRAVEALTSNQYQNSVANTPSVSPVTSGQNGVR